MKQEILNIRLDLRRYRHRFFDIDGFKKRIDHVIEVVEDRIVKPLSKHRDINHITADTDPSCDPSASRKMRIPLSALILAPLRIRTFFINSPITGSILLLD